MSDQLIYVIGHCETPRNYRTGLKSRPTVDEQFCDYYKIGIAEDVETRLSALRVGTPHKLYLITTLESDKPKKVESILHNIYHSGRQSGEWFFLTSNAVNSLRALDRIDYADVEGFERFRQERRVHDTSLYVEVERNRREGA